MVFFTLFPALPRLFLPFRPDSGNVLCYNMLTLTYTQNPIPAAEMQNKPE